MTYNISKGSILPDVILIQLHVKHHEMLVHHIYFYILCYIDASQPFTVTMLTFHVWMQGWNAWRNIHIIILITLNVTAQHAIIDLNILSLHWYYSYEYIVNLGCIYKFNTVTHV